MLFLGCLLGGAVGNTATISDLLAKASRQPVDSLSAYLDSIDDGKPRVDAGHVVISIDGAIKPGDERLVKDHLNRLKKGGRAHVFVKSTGGDVQTAAKIGRMLRQVDATVSTSLCKSACVLVLVGGVERMILTHAQKGLGVGIHRLYFTNLPAGISKSEIARRRESAKNEVASYLKEMNISSRLLDLMEAIPPEKMKMLTEAEIADFGLDAPDPVWDEEDVAKQAAKYATTSSEYRIRRVSVNSQCHEETRHPSPATSQAYIDCKEAVLQGQDVSSYRVKR